MIFFASPAQPNTSDLSTLGVPGLIFVIVVLAGVIVFQWRSNRADIKTKDDQITALQERRVVELVELINKLSGPLEKQTQLSQVIYDLLTKLNDARK